MIQTNIGFCIYVLSSNLVTSMRGGIKYSGNMFVLFFLPFQFSLLSFRVSSVKKWQPLFKVSDLP